MTVIFTPGHFYTCVCGLHAQSCPTLCDPMECSLPGPSVHRIFQARIPERVAIPPPRDLPGPGIEPPSIAFPALAGRFFTTVPPGKPIHFYKWFSMMLLSLSRNRPKTGKIYGERASQAWPRPKVLVRETPFSKREMPFVPRASNRELHREEIKLASFAVAWIKSPSWHKEQPLRVLEAWLGKLFQTQVQPWL